MSESIDPIGQIRRDQPGETRPQGEVQELLEVWSLYIQWKAQRRALDNAQDHMTFTRPENAQSIEKFLGDQPEFNQAGATIKASITARLAEIQKYDLQAAVARGELSAEERSQVEQITLQWQREAELEAATQNHERDDERSR